MKFKPGQIVVHKPTKSRWIIMGSRSYDENEHVEYTKPHKPTPEEKYQLVVTAYCLYSGSKPDYWQPNQLDDWVMTYRDCENHDVMWTII